MLQYFATVEEAFLLFNLPFPRCYVECERNDEVNWKWKQENTVHMTLEIVVFLISQLGEEITGKINNCFLKKLLLNSAQHWCPFRHTAATAAKCLLLNS